MLGSRLILRCLAVIALPIIVRAQDAVEYASVSEAGSGLHLGACELNSMFTSCVRHYYPLAFYASIIAILVALRVLLDPKRKL